MEYRTRIDGDVVYVHGPEGADAHAWEIKRRFDTYSRFTAQTSSFRLERHDAVTPQPTLHHLGDPLGEASQPIVMLPVKQEISSTVPRVVNPTLPIDGFIESTLRGYSRDPSTINPGDPKGFMEKLVHQIMNLVRMQILTPLPPDVRLELLKKNSIPFPTTHWSGENDLEKFENWLVELTSWISGNGWKGKGYNELHIDALAHALDGNPKEIVLHEVKQGFENGAIPTFTQLLKKLMLTYMKRSAAVPATKLFKTLAYDSSKGIGHFYTQLLCTLEKMVAWIRKVSMSASLMLCLFT